MALSHDRAKQFFGSLYDNSHTPDLNDFESAALRLSTKIDEHVASGDKALGLLMLNHALADQKMAPARKHALTAAVLMNIKKQVVSNFLDDFPQANLDDLVSSATKAGYKVDVLPPEVAKHLPRSIVQR